MIMTRENTNDTNLDPNELNSADQNDNELIDVPTLPELTTDVLTYNNTIVTATQQYLDTIDLNNIPSADVIEQNLIGFTNMNLGYQNSERDRNQQFPLLKQLTFTQVTEVMLKLHSVVNIAPSDKNTDPDYDLLAVYCDSGDDKGIYLTSENYIRGIARKYNSEITLNTAKEIFALLRERAPRVSRCDNRDLIAVNNGIYNYKTKELMPFDPQYVFISKSNVNLNFNATNPIKQTPDGDAWDVETWFETLSDDPEIIDLFWKIIGAIIRPNVRWNKSAWFYSETGNNGKGTLVELMRNLCGAGSYASLPLADMGKDFMLEPLTRANAIIVDENDVGQFIDKAANLKAIITNDVLMINRKNKVPISYQFFGFMVQCLNEFPRIKDRSESFYRRQLFVPFDKCFTGIERKYIKDQYMSDTDVLEYVLKKVLVDIEPYYSLPEPEATKRVLAEYKRFNDPVRDFWEDHADDFVWDLLPFTFLYEMYRAWLTENNPSGTPIGRNVFINDLVAILYNDPVWYCEDKSKQVRSVGRMLKPEHLIAKYDLKNWMNPVYRTMSQNRDLDKQCMPDIAAAYRGIQRKNPTPQTITVINGKPSDNSKKVN